MNKILVIALATIAAAVTGIALYANSAPREIKFQYNETAPEGFRMPDFVEVHDFTADEVRDIEKMVCGGVGREDWVPLRVDFAYLEPRETIYRIPCGIGPPGYFYRSFYLSSIGPEIIDEYNPNKQFIFDIRTPAQAAEYVMFFDIVLSGDKAIKQFAITEDQYDKWAGQCVRDNQTSAVRELTMNETGDGYDIQVNFVDYTSGSFEYRHYLVTRDGKIELEAEEQLGHCGFAI